ncbi:T9SS type A sorting domain-containing protein [Chryseobacterium luquanense]|uniref:T9SS type A sorting domain-containing protein n=1 Tax=Chryseobacterium luquanense TaxID=2983766 RepID=A0ABT3XZT2_9FLAO|nr:T9SS type A sorting domain-containing protein [Chryseobacterium luquanense]MCX8531418.1 T9SS type A sorting domain-containing protein [Chryseobacterium luquanense]
MKRKLLSLGVILTLAQLNAQTYQSLTVTGFNADVIANGVGPSLNSTTMSLDKDTDNFAYMSRDFKVNSSATALTYGLPENGLITSAVATTSGLTYQMASYSGNNSLRLPNANDAGTLTFATPKAANNLYVLAVSGSGDSTGDITVNFQDGTTQVFSSTNFQDWYGGTNAAIQGIGRINRATNVLDAAGGTNPRIYQITLAISTANQSKLITSVTVKKTSTAATVINVFGISAQVANLSVSDAKKVKEKSVYPNPFSSELNLANVSEVSSIEILDFSGKSIKTNIQPESKLDLSSLDKGNYILVLKNKNGTLTSQKVVKK